MATGDHRTARLAGLFYLILVVTGILNLMYLPSQYIVSDSPLLTLQHIQQSPQLVRWNVALGMLSYLAFLALVFALYQLLHKVDKAFAKIMVILVLISIPMSFLNLTEKLAILDLVQETSNLSNDTLAFQIRARLDAFNRGIVVTQVFWGLWLFPFGWLVYRSGFLPKILGIFLMLGCIGYLIECFAAMLWPSSYPGSLLATIANIPSSVGEIGICLWLLMAGSRPLAFWKKEE